MKKKLRLLMAMLLLILMGGGIYGFKSLNQSQGTDCVLIQATGSGDRSLSLNIQHSLLDHPLVSDQDLETWRKAKYSWQKQIALLLQRYRDAGYKLESAMSPSEAGYSFVMEK